MINKINKGDTNKNIPPAIDHDVAMIDELRADPAYAEIYLQTALEDIDEPGGAGAFLAALRHTHETTSPGLPDECRRQSHIVAQADAQDTTAGAFLDEVIDDVDEWD
ncbi:antitoxin MazE-like protein [Salmonella enterica subsp. diarizonae]